MTRLRLGGYSTPLTFAADSTKVFAKNIGGDYWTATAKFLLKRGDTAQVQYKFFANVDNSITAADKGWENNLSGIGNGGNRILKFGPYNGNKDTTIPLQYANGRAIQAQFWKPYVPSADSVAVMFRVNVQPLVIQKYFDPTKTNIGVRGDMTNDNWSSTIILKKESPDGNAGQTPYDGTNFYSAVYNILARERQDQSHINLFNMLLQI